MKFWNTALKYHAPATISGYIFFKLVSTLLSSETFFMRYPYYALAILVIIANFCAYLLYRATLNSTKLSRGEVSIIGNKISKNEIGKNFEISTEVNDVSMKDVKIENNEIIDNRVKGDFFIGVKDEK